MPAKLGVSFNGYHTLRDWGLHWDTVSIGPPQPITSYISVPGRRTKIDITESLYGEVTYENRQLQFGFWIEGSREYWHLIYSKINNTIGGRRVKVILDTDPANYWMGRATVSAEISPDNPHMAFFTINVDAEPYKYETKESTDAWLWDPFNFEIDQIVDYSNIKVPSKRTVTVSVKGPVIPVRPYVSSSQTIQLTVDDSSYELPIGDKIHIWEKVGEKDFVFKNDGPSEATVTIWFRGESL